MCKELDDLVSNDIACEVSKYAAQMSEEQPRKLLRYNEVCDMFGINNGTLRNWAAKAYLK